jgi:hypothetical protein
MKRRSFKDRLFISQWYFGSSQISQFTRRPKIPFGDIKKFFRLKAENDKYTELSPLLRKQIKQQMREEYLKERSRKVLAFIISVFISIILLSLLIWIIRWYIGRLPF